VCNVCGVCGRPIRASDWDEISKLEKGAQNAADAAAQHEDKMAAAATKEQKQLSYEQQKRRSQAPKRIAKIELEIGKLETDIEAIDAEMMSRGSDVALLQVLAESAGRADRACIFHCVCVTL
jgi:hypothetical protein